MKSLFFLLVLFSLVNGNTDHDSSRKTSTTRDLKLLKLHDDNLVSIRGPIDQDTVARFVNDIYKIKDKNIVIYISSPGGSVISGNQIVQTISDLAATGKSIECVADLAASMAFVIFQSCPTRYTRPQSILMQHQMQVGFHGPLENVKNRLKLISDIEDDLDHMQSEKLNLSYNEFKSLTVSDWWIYGRDNVNKNTSDEVVNVACDFNFEGKSFVVTKKIFLFTVELEYSLCPLISDPLRVDVFINEKNMEFYKQMHMKNFIDDNGNLININQYDNPFQF